VQCHSTNQPLQCQEPATATNGNPISATLSIVQARQGHGVWQLKERRGMLFIFG
jgi:hypothetical protein